MPRPERRQLWPHPADMFLIRDKFNSVSNRSDCWERERGEDEDEETNDDDPMDVEAQEVA